MHNMGQPVDTVILTGRKKVARMVAIVNGSLVYSELLFQGI